MKFLPEMLVTKKMLLVTFYVKSYLALDVIETSPPLGAQVDIQALHSPQALISQCTEKIMRKNCRLFSVKFFVLPTVFCVKLIKVGI